ncbi:ImmA/IrrE family metallo-endopeptidase [Deinococcus peraridilitoris]|uniref:Putative Zn peptidase n=1 Tax=Deinococcus peraridilitoris (strain DSM 19664 / LMG 22246 / CIP 109416 / KR-200) TaxID=937777 RepID=L0A268_DEIPD|nr:ImmA/IrrE family metallo-endopeptidase [Deinococcus peraridilitoris]AFZ67539.1 putative Zn peptidase [Deinococcus peraridilitoris DSM 19664]
MDALIADFLNYVQTEHQRTGYETDPQALCRKLNIEYRIGGKNMAYGGDPAFIYVKRDENGPRRLFNSAHEIIHVLMARGGYKTLIQHEHACLGKKIKEHIEQLVNFGAAQLIMPHPLLTEAHRRFGDTPAAIIYLTTHSGASIEAAMRRWAWQDITERRAAFLTYGSYVHDITSCNYQLPFWLYDRIPEPHVVFEEAKLLCLPDSRKYLGTFTAN